MKFTIGATIPTTQYGNLQPSIEVEALTIEEARAIALPQIEELWDMYAERPLKKKTDRGIELECFTGGSIWFNKDIHVYTNQDGARYLSGSTYAAQYEKPFDTKAVSEAYAKKHGGEAAYWAAQWQLNSDCSRGFGTAIHAALELFGTYGVVHKHPVLKKVVESFYEVHKEAAVYEAVIANHTLLQCGTVDRLVIVDEQKKICRVEDFKTDSETASMKFIKYAKQLNFYSNILRAAGWKTETPILHHWNGTWASIPLEGFEV